MSVPGTRSMQESVPNDTLAASASNDAPLDSAKEPPLDSATLKKRLALGNPALVRELYEIVQRQLQTETGRQTRLDAKANSLLTATGLAITVVSVLISDRGVIALREVQQPYGVIALGLAAAAVACALAAAGLAVWALRVRSYSGMNEHSIFKASVLQTADAADYPGSHDKDEDRKLRAEAEKEGVMEYQKAMILHIWPITQLQTKNHDRKACVIQAGQFSFVGFLVLLFFACATLAVAVSQRTFANPAPSHLDAAPPARVGPKPPSPHK